MNRNPQGTHKPLPDDPPDDAGSRAVRRQREQSQDALENNRNDRGGAQDEELKEQKDR